MNKIICGDSLTILKTLDSESVDCCITSSPYWGLRDYGTAKWEGGSSECDHKGKPFATKCNVNRNTGGNDVKNQEDREFYKEVCGKCGAKRIDNQLGLEKTPEEYVAKMVEIFGEVKRVLKKERTLWLNLGDSYWGGGFGTSPGGDEDFASRYPKQASNKGSANHETRKKLGALKKHHAILKTKDLVGIPWRTAFALQKDGWYLRQDIIWHKPNPMPESVTDRCTKAHEYIFLLAKSQKYYFDNEAISEPVLSDSFRIQRPMTSGVKAQLSHYTQGQPQGRTCGVSKNGNRNKRSVWTVTTKPFKGAHFATFPEDLILPCVLAGCPKDGVILDPFFGAGTTGVVAKKNNRNYIGIELNSKYIEMAQRRIDNTMGMML